MGERIPVSSVKNPEYPLIKGYVEQALIEDREGKPLGGSLRRAAGYMARYIAIWSSLLPSQQGKEIVELDQVVLRGKGFQDRVGSIRYSVRVEKKARELLPGWMEVRQVVSMSQHDEVDIAEQERQGLEKYLAGIKKDNL